MHLKLSVEYNKYPLFLPDYVDFPSWGGQSGHRLEVMPQSKFSGVSGCSDAAVSQGSICSTPTPGDIVIGKTIINQEMQVVVLCCCVTTKYEHKQEHTAVMRKENTDEISKLIKNIVSIMVSFRWKVDIRRRPCLSSLAEEGGAPPHHQPQLLCRNQRPRNRTTDVNLTFSSYTHFLFEMLVQSEQ